MVLTDKLRRPSALAVAVLLVLASMSPLLSRQKASAYGLITAREIKMSSSASGASTAGQDVTYDVSFVVPSGGNIGGLVVDFCANSPIIGDTCTAPTGFDTNETNLVVPVPQQSGVTDWTVDAATTANKVVLARTAANVAGSTTISFDLGGAAGNDGITNPTNSNTTFYARILTFTTTGGAQSYTSIAPGAEPPLAHAGGVALSTAAQITVTAKVQERLTFCVYTSAANYTDCSAVSGTAVPLGDTNGVLSDAGPFVDKTAKYNVSTNASNNVTIRAKGATLTSGSFTINGMGATANNSTAGTEEFGFCTYRDTGGGVAGLTPATPYDDGACSATTQTAGTAAPGGAGAALFAFDVTTAGNNLSTTFGNTIASKTPGAQSTGVLVFIGNIATTTEPGIYTSTLTFIATGNY
ncbi:hypothetical protein H0X10_02935 [Candidatus Saccharibacteria bacterium]|nr:hypothetical protein [Candidatus Saccharibacteria bacterium]